MMFAVARLTRLVDKTRSTTDWGTSLLAKRLVATLVTMGWPTVWEKALVNEYEPLTTIWVKTNVVPQGTVEASRYAKGVRLVAVPPSGMLGYVELACVKVTPLAEVKRGAGPLEAGAPPLLRHTTVSRIVSPA